MNRQESWQGNPTVDPSIWFVGDHGRNESWFGSLRKTGGFCKAF
jgi:hypothetical protein